MRGPLDTHARYRELLAARLDRPLTRGENRGLAGHLKSCAACQQADRDYREQRALLRSLGTPVPPRDLWARTSTALDREVSRVPYGYPRVGRRALVRAGRSGAPSALATVVAALGVITVLVALQVVPSLRAPTTTTTDAPATVAAAVRPTPFAVRPQALALVGADASDLTFYETRVDQVCPASAPDCFDDSTFVKRRFSVPSDVRPENATLSSAGRVAFVGRKTEGDVIAVVLLTTDSAPTNGGPSDQPPTPPAPSVTPTGETQTTPGAAVPTDTPSDSLPPATATTEPSAETPPPSSPASPTTPVIESPASATPSQTATAAGDPSPTPPGSASPVVTATETPGASDTPITTDTPAVSPTSSVLETPTLQPPMPTPTPTLETPSPETASPQTTSPETTSPETPSPQAHEPETSAPQTPVVPTAPPQTPHPPETAVPGMSVVSILEDVHSAGAPPAWSRDGEILAFSAMPADGSHGPDVYTWRPGDRVATAITSDHSSFFASWSGRRVVVSRIGAPASEGGAEASEAHVETVVVDVETREERIVSGPQLWLPVVDPVRQHALAWRGTLGLVQPLPEPREGALYIVDWTALDPFRTDDEDGDSDEPGPPAMVRLDPARDPASRPVVDWHAHWSSDGQILGVWEADAPKASWGKLLLVALDPETGSFKLDDPLLGPALAKRGFTLGTDRVAWVAPTSDAPDGELRIRTWSTDGVGDLRIESLKLREMSPSF